MASEVFHFAKAKARCGNALLLGCSTRGNIITCRCSLEVRKSAACRASEAPQKWARSMEDIPGISAFRRSGGYGIFGAAFMIYDCCAFSMHHQNRRSNDGEEGKMNDKREERKETRNSRKQEPFYDLNLSMITH